MLNKADSLLFLSKNITEAKILPQIQLKESEFIFKKDIEEFITSELPGTERFAVRSSFSEEDGVEFSNAGKFKSFIDIEVRDLKSTIAQVFDSYPKTNNDEIVFVQPYFSEAIRSGVIFSHVPSTGQPYLVDNYVVSSDTETITSGRGEGFKHTCLRDETVSFCSDKFCHQLKGVVQECMSVLGYKYIDIEYAINAEEELFVFQARPLRVQGSGISHILNHLASTSDFITNRMRSHPFISGKSTIYGVMPDWNPAEMIGRKPKRLALSLYRELITDSIWAYQRDNYGYKNLRSFPLLVELNHQPYIDTRVSFNSLLPKGISAELENKLIDFYLDKLSRNKDLHDKIEFEIVLSSWTFDISTRLENLTEEFTRPEKTQLLNSLLHLTREVILGRKIEEDIGRVKRLQSRISEINSAPTDSIRNLFWLLEDCKRWGTLPFAGLARAAFIATQIIKSLERTSGSDLLTGLIEDLDMITSQMQKDIINLDQQDFLDKYGHLRPGTYDITSKTYREAFELYFGGETANLSTKPRTTENKLELMSLLHSHNLYEEIGIKPEEFIDFAKKAIYWREQSKFEFTKSLSKILDLILDLGSNLGFSRDDLAYLNIRDLMESYSTSKDLRDVFLKSIESGKAEWKIASSIELPSLVVCESDLFTFTEQDAMGNFVTNSTVSGRPISNLKDIQGAIVLIESADPGFDWIFQHKILALVTAWGGANSHMAIRCAELGIPAVIGVGERIFKELQFANTIHIDCGNKIIEHK